MSSVDWVDWFVDDVKYALSLFFLVGHQRTPHSSSRALILCLALRDPRPDSVSETFPVNK